MISVVVLGAGNVGSHLVRIMQSVKKVNLVQWYSRDKNSIKSDTKDIELCNDLKNLKTADIYIIAVTDKAIEALSKKLPFENRLVVHTSGSAGLYDIDKKHKRGVFYPLQTFSKGADVDFSEVPICIEALNNKEDLPILKALAEAIGSKTHKVNSDQRAALHLAAVFVNNFTNQMFRIAHEITESYGAEFDILKPLIKETARKLDELSPFLAQTGPAKRNDKKTIKKHLKLLEDKHHKDVYELFTKSIQKTHGSKKL